LIEAAQSQLLQPEEQQLANLYDHTNPLRESYLRAKYQMFINQNLRQELAVKIKYAREQLEDL